MPPRDPTGTKTHAPAAVHRPAADPHDANAPVARKPSARSRARAAAYTPPPVEPVRRPASERENAFNMLVWLMEGATGLLEEMRHNDLGLSEEFWVHAHIARRETLLAARAAIDSLLEKIDAAERAEQERRQRRERRGSVKIDF